MSVVLRSALLERHGFFHGFSLRTGGVSEGAFASLNLGRTVGDEPDRVAENSRRFCQAAGCTMDRLFEVSQVHGGTVVEVRASDVVPNMRRIEADALVTGNEGDSVAVRTADCLPVLLADPATGAVGAVHAGWRGVVANVVLAALERLVSSHGARPERLLAAIGPHIRVDAFEVGPEVARAIARAAPGAEVVQAREPRPHVDLAAAVRAQLLDFGLAVERIDDVGGCTYREPDRFFSHRRDAGRTGRHLSVITAR